MTSTPTPVPEPLRADGSCVNCGKTGGHTFTCWWARRYSTGPAPSTPGEGTGEQRCVHCGQSPDDPGASMCQIDGISTGKLHDFQPGEGAGRPGGWVEGIGWVALLCDLAPGDVWAPHLPPAQPTHVVGMRHNGTMGASVPFSPSVVIITRWADGSTPQPPVPPQGGERPDTDTLRKIGAGTDGDGITLLTRAERAFLARAADWIDAQPPVPPPPAPQADAQIRSDAAWIARLARGSSWPGEMAQRVEDACDRVTRWAAAPSAPSTDTARLREIAAIIRRPLDKQAHDHADAIEHAADTLDARAPSGPCPYIATGDEGTSHCSLAESRPAPVERPQPDGDRMATLLSRFAWLADSARSEGFQEAAAAYTVCCDELSDALTPAPSSSPVGDRPWMEPSAVVDALEAMSARLTNITGTQAAQLLVAADYVRLHIGAAADRGEPTP